MRKLSLPIAIVTIVALGSFVSWAHAATWGHVAPSSSSRVLTAGTGLTGGGDLSADRTFNVIANADGSIVANANDIQVGILATDAQHGNRGGGGLHANAVAAGAAGFMTGADKTKLDGIASGANAIGAASSTDNSILRADGTGGKTFQDSGATTVIDDSGRIGLATAVPTHSLTLASASTGWRHFNTSDQVTNTEAATGSWSANVYSIAVAAAGSGAARALHLTSASLVRVAVGNGILDVAAAGSVLTSTGATTTNATLGITPISALSSTSAVQSSVNVNATVNQTSGTGGFNGYLCNPTLTAVGSAGAKCFRASVAGSDRWWVDATSGVQDTDSTITAAATTGNQTINKPCGTVNIAAAGTAVTVTNSLVTANSIISTLARTNDGTCAVKNYVPGAGTVTINMTAACTAETSVGFCIIDKN